ncbi:MAG: choice-of-anchor tandem repeat GloVer-containing protein [Verrucomicrobiota bacterium]|jgi:uncharacterized repeat protein (TIGR03803 family)
MIDLNYSQNLAPSRRAGCFLAVFVLAGFLAGPATAQTFMTLHSFDISGGPYPDNFNGGLVLSGNTLYGAQPSGGTNGNGTVFAVNTDGTGFRILHTFTALPPFIPPNQAGTNVDGAQPMGGLILSSNTLYGTTAAGGSSGNGTVFAVNTDGTGFTTLYSFSAPSASAPYGNTDGTVPNGGLVLAGNTLYGTASQGGNFDNGTIFAVNTDGTGFTTLHDFTGTSGSSGTFGSGTNSDGTTPYAGLILSGNTLYGTTRNGGTNGNGTVFGVDTDGTGFTTLYSFSASSASGFYGNTDGANSYAALIISGNTLYGTASQGGNSDNGTIFAVNTDGTGFFLLHAFTSTENAGCGMCPYYNVDGAEPKAGLMLSGNTLYGTAYTLGNLRSGTIFAVNTDGSGFTILHTFTRSGFDAFENSDGASPLAGLVVSDNKLYGTTSRGGTSADGTVFSISFPPQLSIIPSAPNIIVTWPTNYLGFDYSGYALQSTTNLGSLAGWTAVSPSPVLIGGQKVVVNPSSGSQQYFRLSH